MESLLHYIWQHHMHTKTHLTTTDGQDITIIDYGQHNMNQGPDFINAKVEINGTIWAGNIEMHTLSSDWNRHGHNLDPVFNTTILHVVEKADTGVQTQNGISLPQIIVAIPKDIQDKYNELNQTSEYPRCHNFIHNIPEMKIHSWMDTLLLERLIERSKRINRILRDTSEDWERTTFVILARSLGFGLNGDPMERWAMSIPFNKLHNKGRKQTEIKQTEKLFLEKSEAQNTHWRRMRIRPKNHPEAKIRQLAGIINKKQCTLTEILQASNSQQLTQIFMDAGFSKSTATLLTINAACPLMFAYGMHFGLHEYQDKATDILSDTKSEDNYIIRQWKACNLSVSNAADSQALLQLKHEYCDHARCLKCRFGFEFLSQTNVQKT